MWLSQSLLSAFVCKWELKIAKWCHPGLDRFAGCPSDSSQCQSCDHTMSDSNHIWAWRDTSCGVLRLIIPCWFSHFWLTAALAGSAACSGCIRANKHGLSCMESPKKFCLFFWDGGEAKKITAFPSCSMPLGLFERVKFGKTKPFCLISAHFIYPVIKSSAPDNTPVCTEALPLPFSKSSQPNCPPFFLQWLSQPASRRTHWALSFQQRSFLQHKPLEIALSSPCQLLAFWMLQFLPSVRELFKYPPKPFTIFQEQWILSLSHKASFSTGSWKFHPVHFSCWNLFLTHFFCCKKS